MINNNTSSRQPFSLILTNNDANIDDNLYDTFNIDLRDLLTTEELNSNWKMTTSYQHGYIGVLDENNEDGYINAIDLDFSGVKTRIQENGKNTNIITMNEIVPNLYTNLVKNGDFSVPYTSYATNSIEATVPYWFGDYTFICRGFTPFITASDFTSQYIALQSLDLTSQTYYQELTLHAGTYSFSFQLGSSTVGLGNARFSVSFGNIPLITEYIQTTANVFQTLSTIFVVNETTTANLSFSKQPFITGDNRMNIANVFIYDTTENNSVNYIVNGGLTRPTYNNLLTNSGWADATKTILLSALTTENQELLYWNFTNGSVINIIPSGQISTLNHGRGGSAFIFNQSIPNYTASISQTLTLTAGTYQFSYDIYGRIDTYGLPTHSYFEVYFGNTAIALLDYPSDTIQEYQTKTYNLTITEERTDVLTIYFKTNSTNNQIERTSIRNITLVNLADPDLINYYSLKKSSYVKPIYFENVNFNQIKVYLYYNDTLISTDTNYYLNLYFE